MKRKDTVSGDGTDMAMNNEWQRVKTTRLYLHPPKAERLYTLWREGKIILGEMEAPITKDCRKLTAAGIWFLYGDSKQADFKESEYSIREDGIPVHKLTIKLGALTACLECVTDFARVPTCFIKMTLKNETDATASERIGYILRRGLEDTLVFSFPDVYAIYNPDVKVWLDAKNTWEYDGIWRDGEYFATCSDTAFSAECETGCAFADVTLGSGEERTVFFSLGKGTPCGFDFDAVVSETVAKWERELARINKLPEKIANDPEQLRAVKNLAVQLLQCFAYEVGGNDLFARQGGLQRRVWTYEAMPVLEALDRIGDFDDYVEPVIDVYFNKFGTDTGEIVPLGIHWAMATATVLYSFGAHAKLRGKEYYLKYRDAAVRSFEWIEKTRSSSEYGGKVAQVDEDRLEGKYQLVDGLFPPMRSCDDPLIFQAWLTTDGNNIIGVREFAEAAKMFADERADEIYAGYKSYKKIMSDCWEKLKASAGDTDELEVPYTPLGNTEEVVARFHFAPSKGFLVNALQMKREDYERILRFYERRKLHQKGIYSRMPARDANIPGVVVSELMSDVGDDGLSNIWYVCSQEYGFFKYLLRDGDFERCREIIDSIFNFATSDEYYMVERYHQKNPWYAPWQPNASASGRLINMLLDLASV